MFSQSHWRAQMLALYLDGPYQFVQSAHWDHAKDIHSNLDAHCKANGGWPVVHSKHEIRLARPLGLRSNFTLDGHPKASTTETNG